MPATPNGPDHLRTLWARKSLASCYVAVGKAEEAKTMLEDVRDRFTKRSGLDDIETLAATYELANCCRVLGDLKPAEALAKDVLDRRRKAPGMEHPDTLKTMDLLGLVRTVRGDDKAAEDVLLVTPGIREKTSPDDWSRFHTESLLGGCLIGQKKHAEAETHLLSAYGALKTREKTMAPRFKRLVSEAADRLIRLYDAWGKPDQSDAWRRQPSPRPPNGELPPNPFAEP